MDNQASQTTTKLPVWKRPLNSPLLLVVIIMAWGAVSMINSTSTPSSTPTQPTQSFSTIAREHFDQVLESSPELEAIRCEGGDCDTVVYFDYKTIPDDVEYVIRGNAVTFSNLRKRTVGTSHVSVAARFNGNVFFACDAAQGAVTECQNYSR